MIRYLLFEAKDDGPYKVLVNENSVESEAFELSCESLSLEGYESVTDVDSDVESVCVDGEKRTRKIRFADRKEVIFYNFRKKLKNKTDFYAFLNWQSFFFKFPFKKI